MISDLALQTEMGGDDLIFDDSDFDLSGTDEDMLETEDEPESEGVIRISPKDLIEKPDDNEVNEEDEYDQLDKLIDDLPDNFPKSLLTIRSKIAPVIALLDDSLVEYYVDKLKKKTGTLKKPIMDEIKLARQNLLAEESETETAGADKIKSDPEIKQLADEIAQDPLLFKNKIDIVNQLGVINERKPIGLYLVTIDSRCLPMGSTGSEALALKNSGPYGAGKSHPMFACLKLYPKTVFHLITSGSAKSLYNIEGGLKHKALILAEALQLQSDSSGDNELAYSIRSLVSEGSLTYQYTGYNSDGKKVTIIKKMRGPTSLLSTTVRGRLEAQLEDRLVTVHPNTSSKQTQDILEKTADIASGNIDVVDNKTISAWKLFHDSLVAVEVIIPFARNIGKYVNAGGELPISARRAFKRVLSVIKTIATIYQKQRDRDELGRVIATIEDYAIAFQLIEESFRENLGEHKKYTDKRINLIERKGQILPRILAGILDITGSALSQWMKPLTDKGVLTWCDEKGLEFSDVENLEKAKRSGKAYIRVSRPSILPTPYQLTRDEKWNEGGEFYKMYDLDLEKGNPDNADLDEDDDLSDMLNTSKDSDGGDISKDNDDSREGDKVLSQISHKELIKKMRKEREKNNSEPDESKVMELATQVVTILKNDSCEDQSTEGVLTI